MNVKMPNNTKKKKPAALSGRLLQRINRQTAEQFGIEVCGFLRQNFTRQCNLSHLLHAYRIGQKRHLRLSTSRLIECLVRIANVADMLLVADRFLGNSQNALQKNFMQLNYVK